MIHNITKTKYLLYLDGSLDEIDTGKIEKHLAECPHCSEELAVLSKLWKNKTAIKRLSAPDNLWTRLENRINQFEQPHIPVNIFKPQVQLALRLAFAILGLIIAFGTGIYLGNFPEPEQNPILESNQYIARSYHLDSFEPVSDESIGQIPPLMSDQNK